MDGGRHLVQSSRGEGAKKHNHVHTLLKHANGKREALQGGRTDRRLKHATRKDVSVKHWWKRDEENLQLRS